MFTPARYVVIDDNEQELRALVDALHGMGAPCIGIKYNAATGVEPHILRGVRVLFLDLHLVGGVQVGKQEKAFEVIRDLLDTSIADKGGPYVIVLWTAHAEERDEFEEYVTARMEAHKRPLAILSLNKNDYIAGGKADGKRLSTDIAARVAADPRLQALLLWERDVLAAASETLGHLGDLIDPADRTPAHYGDRLDDVLSILARAAAGRDHAANNIRGAVNAALAPILADRIANQGPDPDADKIWKAAVTKIGDAAPLPEKKAASVNTVLHLALPPGEPVKPTDWGALILLPEEVLTDEVMRSRFGITAGELMFTACPTDTKPERKKCALALLRLGASCDHAQNRKGPMACVAVIVVPAGTRLKDQSRISKALLATPILDIPNYGISRIFVDARFQISLVREELEKLEAVARIREQLLMQVAAHCAEYSMRPGIVSIDPPEAEAERSGLAEGSGAAAPAKDKPAKGKAAKGHS